MSHNSIEIVVSKGEFIKLLREDFITYMNRAGLNHFILNNQREMFTNWDCYFYPGKVVRIKK